MSLLLQLLIHEVVHPFAYGLGWLLVFVFTLGKVRPKKGAFFKTPLVGLLGIYAWCALPVVLVLSWRAMQEW
jgi:hypothetical protein